MRYTVAGARGRTGLVPDEIESWQGCPNRLHDRLRYRRLSPAAPADAPAWHLERLAP